MSWSWQDVIVFVVTLVTAGAFWLNHRRRKTRRGPGGCGCDSAPVGTPPSVTYRARRGERPQIVVRPGR